jgi:hypothetical protein
MAEGYTIPKKVDSGKYKYLYQHWQKWESQADLLGAQVESGQYDLLATYQAILHKLYQNWHKLIMDRKCTPGVEYYTSKFNEAKNIYEKLIGVLTELKKELDEGEEAEDLQELYDEKRKLENGCFTILDEVHGNLWDARQVIGLALKQSVYKSKNQEMHDAVTE